MSARRRVLGGCLALLTFVLIAIANPSTVLAQAASSADQNEQRRSQAKREFAQGVEHYRAGRYTQAVTAFLEADQLAPSPALSYNIARAYERLEETAGALRWYRDYLRRSPSAKNAAEVEARVAELASELAQRGVQQLTVLSTPSGAKVVVDGRTLGITPFTGELLPGRHSVLLVLAGYRDSSSEVVIAPRSPAELNLELQAAPAPIAGPTRHGHQPVSLSRSSDRASQERFGILPWLVAGTGVVGLGGALGFELARRADERDAREAPTQLAYQEELAQMERDQLRARVLAGVGGGLVVTGGVLLLFNDSEPTSPRVGVGCTTRGCTASAKGSF